MSNGVFSLRDLLTFPVSRRWVYPLFALFSILQISLFTVTYLQGQPRLLLQVLAPVTPGQPIFERMIYGALGEGMFDKPMAVTWSLDRIFVSDTGNRRIQVFDTAGNFLFLFGEQGSGPGQFLFPYGLAATADLLYVADLYTGRISTFDLEGNFQGFFAEAANEAGKLQSPGALLLSGDKLYVTDVRRSRVLVFAIEDGRLLNEIGMEEDILAPNGVALDLAGNIYVSSAGRQRIAVYSPDGRPIRLINGTPDGHGTSALLNPRGIAVTADGRIAVVSMLTHQLAVFDQGGSVLFTHGGMGTGLEQFSFPNGIYLDPAGRLLVTDTVNRRVAVYRW
ncbi:MAG: 6-bladed beta-propeller [Firmicutes bacterium]|nr:6-bladed beta-propeller [Bacillota bacterium]